MLNEELNVTKISEVKVKSEWNTNCHRLTIIIGFIGLSIIIFLGAIAYYNKRKKSLQKLENIFNSIEYKPIIIFHNSIMQKIDFVYNNYLVSDMVNPEISKLSSTELEKIDSTQKELPDFKTEAQRIKKIIENGFCSVINKAIDYPIFNINPEVIKEYLNRPIFNTLNLNSLEDITVNLKKDWEIIVGLGKNIIPKNITFLLKDNLIHSFINDYIVKYSSLSFTFIDIGITIYDTARKIDTVKEIMEQDYYNKVIEIKDKFLNHTKEIKSLLKLIKENSTNKEIKKVIKKIQKIKKKIVKEQNNIKVLINNIKKQIEKNKNKNFDILNAVKSTVNSILSVGKKLIAKPVMNLFGKTICGADTYAKNIKAEKYDNVIDFLADVLKISQNLLNSINTNFENIDETIEQFEKNLKKINNQYYLYLNKILCLISLLILI